MTCRLACKLFSLFYCFGLYSLDSFSMEMQTLNQVVQNLDQNIKCCLSRSFLKLTSESEEFFLYELLIIFMYFFESWVYFIINLDFSSKKFIKSLWIKNASLVDLGRLFFKINTWSHCKFYIIPPDSIFSYNLIKTLTWLDLIFLKSPD